MAGNSWQQPVAGEPSGGSWHPMSNPGVGWIASKTSWSGADSFVTAGYYLEVDFSAAVPVGTKAVRVLVRNATAGGYVYWRHSGETGISDTPDADTEYSHGIATQSTVAAGYQVVVYLDSSRKVRFTTSNTSLDLYISYPLDYMV